MLLNEIMCFNENTQYALQHNVVGYVNKQKSINSEIIEYKKRFNLKNVYRFDLGENVDGFSPEVFDIFNNPKIIGEINEYPSMTHNFIKRKFTKLYDISNKEIILSTGLDMMLDVIARTFLDKNDYYMRLTPDFFLYEEYSERTGAKPLIVNLNETDNFLLTNEKLCEITYLIDKYKPKLFWISNPNNPSGQIISNDVLEQILKITNKNNVFVVIDEAYGEYNPNDSMINYVHKYDNLMVLRTLSKAYGLAGIRLGYLITSSTNILNALLTYRYYFPITKLTQEIAITAIEDQQFLIDTIIKNNERKDLLFKNLIKLKTFKNINSHSNIFIIKNDNYLGINLHMKLKEFGVFTSLLDASNKYIRITIRNNEDNQILLLSCEKINENYGKLH
jgi:histidinol-phosphate aminotransferase